MENLINLFINSVFVGNILLAYFLGMCSFLAISKNLKTAAGLGLAVIFVLTLTTPANWLIYPFMLAPGALAWIGLPSVNLSFLKLVLFIATIAAIVQAYKKDKDVHILSTPQILTTDNKEASIIVGKNVPFQTRSAAESAIETYSSFEYKDVGITLKITPQISKDRLVRLNIYQEVTKLDEFATTSNDRPTTLKRTIDTTVIVKDGNTVVIGGLIDDSFSETEYRVPCLGDIPGLGWLFRSKSRSSEKTNLFVFLTPRVLKNPEEARKINDEKQDQMDKIIEGEIKLYEKESD